MGLNSNSDRKLMILKYLPNLGVVGGSGRGGYAPSASRACNCFYYKLYHNP